MKTIAKVLVAGVVSATVACAADDFDPSYRVTSPRIIAVSADRPYAPPGATVNLQALGHDPSGRPLEWAWATCVNPPAATPTACFAHAAMDKRTTFAIGEGQTSFSFTVPTDTLSSLPAAARANAIVGVLTVACPGKITLETTPNAPAPLRCTDASGRALALEEFDIGMKRVFVRAADSNNNPAIATVSWNGAPWPETEVKEVSACNDPGATEFDECGGDKPTIAAGLAPASFESGVDEFGVPFTESVVTQYYATEGLFEAATRIGSSPETSWVARRPGTTVTLWIVARDNRGGATWTTRSVRVR